MLTSLSFVHCLLVGAPAPPPEPTIAAEVAEAASATLRAPPIVDPAPRRLVLAADAGINAPFIGMLLSPVERR